MAGCVDHGCKGDKQAYALAPRRPDGTRLGKHVEALVSRTGEQPDGRDARHLCNNKRCINGEHLVWGSRADNMRDTGIHVLLDTAVAQMRAEYTGARGEQARLAKKYNISFVTAHQLLRGKRR